MLRSVRVCYDQVEIYNHSDTSQNMQQNPDITKSTETRDKFMILEISLSTVREICSFLNMVYSSPLPTLFKPHCRLGIQQLLLLLFSSGPGIVFPDQVIWSSWWLRREFGTSSLYRGFRYIYVRYTKV